MSDKLVRNLLAERIGGKKFGKDTKIYKFEKIKIAKREAIAKNPGKELIDMGVGEPDDIAPALIRNTLQKEMSKPENRGYADNGISAFKKTVADYMKKEFGVKGINPETEVNHAIGSKSALSILPYAFINPGDIVLMTVPGYPVFGTHAEWLGAKIINLPLKRENNFLPDLKSIKKSVLKKTKVLVINYPNNPTGANATKKFYKEVVKFAKQHKIIIIQDAAYAALDYKHKKPLSFLSVPGAKDVGIELHSLSKAYNMTGWRISFVVGNSLLVQAFANVKDNCDSGQFIAIQKAAMKGLENPGLTQKIREKYSRRLDLLVKLLNESGFDAKKPDGTFYLYVPIPKGTKTGKKFKTGEDFSQYLIKEKLISTVPWDDAGNYIRFSVTFVAKNKTDEKRVLNEIGKRLKETELVF